MKRKVIGIIGTNGLPGKYGGWDQLVIHLTKKLQSDFDFIVYTSYTNYNPENTVINNAKIKKIKFEANGMQSIPYDIMSLFHAARHCDVLFLCGTSGCIALPLIKLFRKKIVLNPDGQEWKRDKWSKPVQWFLKASERVGVKNSDVVVADNKVIKNYLLAEYGTQSVEIQYGGDHVLRVEMSTQTEKRYGIKKGEYAFKVCRIVPENNIEMILEAFKESPEMVLVLVGNWEFSEYGKELKEKYSKYLNLKLLLPIYEQNLLDELRSNCDIYVHGHSVGGTNPSLVEAMNLGLCIFSYDVSYNRETTENKAYYFSTKNELKDLLVHYTTLNHKNDCAANMLEVAKRRYSWDIITTKYKEVFT